MKNNTLTIIKKEFARFFGDKRMVFTTILMPGLMVYIMYTLMGNIMTNQFTSADNYVASGYVQNMPAELEPVLNELPVEWNDITSDEIDTIQTSLTEKEADLLVIFPENFVAELNSYDVSSGMAAPNVEIYHNSAKPESSDVNVMLTALLESYEASLSNRFDINAGQNDYDTASDQDMTGQLFAMLLPMLLMTFLFSSCISVAPESIAGEKERGTIATLLVTPMKRSSLALGKIISLSCIAMLSGLSSFIGTMLSLPSLMGSTSGLDTSYYTMKDYLLLLGVILSTVLVLVSLISIISAFAKSIKEASSTCSPLTILTIVVSLVPMMGGDMLKNLGMFFLPILNSVLCMNSIFSFQMEVTQVIVTIGMNLVYAGAMTFGLTRIFNSEKAMFSK
ncbi:MAG: ABC transporter permease [Lachnospiraceae bacterium]|nr:ABC transporter permease [Lachnospiraceae bacterium]